MSIFYFFELQNYEKDNKKGNYFAISKNTFRKQTKHLQNSPKITKFAFFSKPTSTQNMKKLLIIITLSILALDAFSQRTVSGIVVDERGEPVIGATIMVRGMPGVGTITDFDGNFSFQVPNDAVELIVSSVGYETQTIRITSDTIVTIRLREVFMGYTCHRPQVFWRFTNPTIGINYDIVNFLFGVSYRNFISRSHSFSYMYKISAQTNFNRDYTFAGSVGINHPFWSHRQLEHISNLSLNYMHKNLSENIEFNFHNISITASAFSQLSRIEYFVEPAFQSLNDKNNFGLTVGLDRNFGLRNYWVRSVFVGFSAGYFSDYWTYSTRAHFHISRNFGLRFIYNRIDNYDFFNVGLTYRFRRW